MPQLATLGNPQPQQPAPYEAIGSIEAQLATAKRKQELAQALMQSGYVPNSGALGALAQLALAWKGNKLNKRADESVAEAMKRKYVEEKRAKDEEYARSRTDQQADRRQALIDAIELKKYNEGDVLQLGDNTIVRIKGNTAVPVRIGNSFGPQPQPVIADNTPPQTRAALEKANQMAAQGVPDDQIQAWLAQQPSMGPPTQEDLAGDQAANQSYLGPIAKGPPKATSVETPESFGNPMPMQRGGKTVMISFGNRGTEKVVEGGPQPKAASDTLLRRNEAAAGAAQQTIDLIDRMRLNKSGYKELGSVYGDIYANMPYARGDVKDAQSDLDTLGGQIALATMSQLKTLSSQGATGFGALNKEELRLLQNSVAALQAGNLSHKKLDSNVQIIRDKMEKIANASNAAAQEGAPETPAPATAPAGKALSGDDLARKYGVMK